MKHKPTYSFLANSLVPVLILGASSSLAYSQTTRTWDGAGVGGTNMDAAANWSGDTMPNGTNSDTAQWDGTVAGPLSLTYTATAANGLATTPGVNLSILGTQTSSLMINEASGTVGPRIQNITVAAGAGAMTFGGTAGTDVLTLSAGAPASPNHTWTNNSSNPVTFSSDVSFGAGGGVTHALTLTGSGNWNVNTSLIRNGSGTINVIKDGTGRLNVGGINALGNAAFTILNGSIDNTSGTALTMTNTTQSWNGDFTFIGSNNLNLGTGTVAMNASRQVTVNANTLTVGGVISGTGFGLTKAGAGTLTFTGTNTYSGGTTVSAGKLVGTSNGFNAGPIAISSGATLTFTGNNQTSTSTVTGSGAILNDTANTVLITGDHTGFTGTFTHNAGANNTQFNSAVSASQNAAYSLLDGEIIFGANGDYTVKFGSFSSNAGENIRGGNTATGTTTVEIGNLGTNTTLSGGLNNGATKVVALTKVGSGTLTLGATNTYGGATIINGGTLQIGNGGVTGALSATTSITNNAALVVNRADSLTMPNTISGTGTLTKQASGTLTLSGANNYSGLSTVSEGTLTFSGSSTTGNISLADFTTLGLKLANPATSVLTGTNNPGLTFGTADATSLAVDFNALTNPTVPVANLGAGVLTLNGTVDVSLANTTSLTTTPNNTTLALLTYGSQGGPGSWNLTTTTAGHTTFALNPTANALYLNISANPVSWSGAASGEWSTATLAAPKNWTLPDTSQTDYIDGDTVLFTNTASTFAVDLTEFVAPGVVTFSNTSNAYTIGSTGGFGIISGSLNFNGSGSVTISNANAYSAGTALNSGTLALNNASAIGTGVLTINGGNLDAPAATTLSTNNAQSWNGDFAFAGTADLDMGTGTVTLGGTGDRAITVAGNLTVGEIKTSGVRGFNKQGAGKLVVTSDGTNTAGSVVSGVLNVAAGTLQTNRASGVTGDFMAAGITGGGTITNGAATERWLFSNATTGSFDFTGTLANGAAGALGFNKSGGSTQTLSGNNTYTATTTAAGGTLILSGANNLTGPTNVTGGGTLIITGTNSSGGAVSVTGAIGSPGILNLQNSNALGTSTVTSVSRHGGIQLQGGITLPDTVTFITSNDGTTSAAVPYAIGNLGGDNTINGTITLTSGGGGTIIQSDSGSLTLNGNITIAAAQTSRGIILQGSSTGANTFNGVLSDLSGTQIASITKAGTGTWTITGTNTYTGATAINAGTLAISGNNALATGAVSVAADATLGGNGNLGGNVTIAANGIHSLAVAATAGAQVTRTIAGTLTNIAGSVLNLTGATPAPGVYTLVTASGGVSALPTTRTGYTGGVVSISGNSLILTVSSPSAYDDWASAKGLTGGNNGAIQDNGDLDGIPNVLEFVLDGNPLASDTGNLPVPTQDATNFYFDFNRRDDSITEVTLTFEYGTTPGVWPSTVAIPSSNTPIAGPPVTITDNGGGTHHVQVIIPKAGNPAMFGRLRAVK